MSEVKRLMKRFLSLYQTSSIFDIVVKGTDKIYVYLATPFKKITFKKRKFNCFGKQYEYLISSYNATWRNERCIEIPPALDFLKSYKNKKILELGNVLKYYDNSLNHDVIDKYEKSENVMNIDIVDFETENKYDAFVSISTIEHIGWDEPIKDSTKINSTFKKIEKLVKSPDNIFISVPLGYNDVLDDHLLSGKTQFKKTFVINRIDSSNNWEEVSLEKAIQCKYGKKFPAANAIFFGIGLKFV